MSRQQRERRLEAEERWPLLRQFIGCHFHQDACLIWGTLEGALDAAIASHPLDRRQALVREWRDWNGTAGTADDIRPLLTESFGVDWCFATALDARRFMNWICETLIVSVRKEAGKDWRP